MGRRARSVVGLALALVAVWASGACGSSGNGSGAAGDGGAIGDDCTTCGVDGASSGRGSGSGGGSGSGSGSGGSSGGSSGSGSGGSSGGDGGIVLPSGRSFPDTSATIAILADQFPSGLTTAQQQFAATHFVGTEKQVLPDTQALRAVNKDFLVLHYHLAMWQSAPNVSFIVDGKTWGNDYPTVTQNETWFWHDTSNQRVTAPDGKFLMNVSVKGFADYWATSLAQQVAAGDYDGIMFDSASPSLLQGWCGQTGAGQEPRLAGTAAHDTSFVELGNVTWIQAWQTWIAALDAALAAKGIPLIPNDSAFVTTWDTTDYALTHGVFSEGFADPTFAVSDWKASTNELLELAAADKLMILQNYLSAPGDLAKRMYYLGNYLLVKGRHSYLDYFAAGALEWYPEWTVDLGAPTMPATTDVGALASGGVYRRDFAKGSVLVNPTSAAVTVPLGGTFQRVVPTGGGAIDASGSAGGSVTTTSVTSVSVAATSAEILLK